MNSTHMPTMLWTYEKETILKLNEVSGNFKIMWSKANTFSFDNYKLLNRVKNVNWNLSETDSMIWNSVTPIYFITNLSKIVVHFRISEYEIQSLQFILSQIYLR
jgi:hypothetical protein